MRKIKSGKFALRGLIATTAFLILSCSKWIDVHAPEQLTLDESLKSKQGFVKILTGIYATMGDGSLYGRELEFGMLDVLAGYWEVPNNHVYSNDYNFAYHAEPTKNRILQIWSNLYMLIRQCNTLLENMDSIQSDPDYALLKGEILGLRAFFHLELFRLFGPVLSNQASDSRSLPYYTQSTLHKVEPVLNSEFLSLLENDLLAAIALMKNDPIRDVQMEDEIQEQTEAYNFLRDQRKLHLNYYAAKALLCRQYNWQGDHPKAAAIARELLAAFSDEKLVRFINGRDQYGNPSDKDIRLNMESLWGLQNKRMNEMISGYLADKSNPQTSLKVAYQSLLINLYTAGSGSFYDVRYRWWKVNADFAKLNDLSRDNPNVSIEKYQITQLINLPELYFTLCEAMLLSDQKLALDYLNAVRLSRNLNPIEWSSNLSSTVLQDLLLDEVRREYIGEGVLFFYYKKWFHTIYRAEGAISPSGEKFVLPIPEEEIF